MSASNSFFVETIRESFGRQSVMKLIGAELTRVDPGVIEISLPYRNDLTQQHGYVHAGIVTTIADSACGYAAYTLMPPDSEVLSVEFKVNLLRPAKGKVFLARADVIKSGRTLTVVRADVFALLQDSSRDLIATMQATIMCLRKQSPQSTTG
jgi:uncharacterized protein (TIGR00369 family)